MMVHQVLEIPGYYYDKEKKKYFKIQHPSSSIAAYSSHDVKRLKLSDEREEAKAAASKKQHGRIKRSRILEETSMGGYLCRSYGQTNLDVPQIFAAGLIAQGHVPDRGFNSSSIFAVDPRPERYGMQSDLWQASNNGLTRLYTQLGGYHGVKLDGQIYVPLTKRSRIDLPIQRTSSRLGNGLASSISINKSCQQIATTWFADGLGDINPIRICTLSSLNGNDMDRAGHIEPIEENTIPTLPHGGTQASRNEGDVFSSAAAPSQSPLRFAFGTSSGILTLSKASPNLEPLKQRGLERHDTNLKDILALEFLTSNILLSGSRHGKLNITDLRDPRFDNTAAVIYHPSSIIHIKHPDRHRIIVAGLNSSLCQYDLRFMKADTFLTPSRKKSRHNRLQTRPILTYDYHNSATISIGFDLDIETGIIAAAQEYDPHLSAVQLFSLHGGYQLRCAALEREFGPMILRRDRKENKSLQPVRCVHFARDVEGRSKSLYVGAAKGLVRYAWAETLDLDVVPKNFS